MSFDNLGISLQLVIGFFIIWNLYLVTKRLDKLENKKG